MLPIKLCYFFLGKPFWIEYRFLVRLISLNKLFCFFGNCAYTLKAGCYHLVLIFTLGATRFGGAIQNEAQFAACPTKQSLNCSFLNKNPIEINTIKTEFIMKRQILTQKISISIFLALLFIFNIQGMVYADLEFT